MSNILISGPAAAGKSQAAKRELDASPAPAVLADFQSLYIAISGDVRGPDGLYPERNADLLPVTEFLRRATITAARQRGLSIVATNSDGSPDRRSFLLELLGEGATETIIDPGESVVRSRLSVRGKLSASCRGAIRRWYGRRGGGGRGGRRR